jgi:uncharacterized protein YndB with AHSA1/START domain
VSPKRDRAERSAGSEPSKRSQRSQGAVPASLLGEPRFVRLELVTSASPERVYAAWSDPERLRRWFPEAIQGSLAVGTRSTLEWPHKSVWWEVEEAQPGRSFVFRWPWLEDDTYTTRVAIQIAPEGYGAHLRLEDGPFDLSVPGVLDAWAEASAGWGQALAFFKAYIDNSVDLRR